MAKVAVHHTTSGQTLYAWFLNSTGQLWNGSAFENYATANIATYNVAMTEQGTASMLYEANVPALAAGFYGVMSKRRVGGSVAESDPVVGTGSFLWTGTDFADLNSMADALLDRANAIETGLTPRQAHRLQVAALAGKLSGAATTTVTIRNVGDSKDRIVATVDADGNRSAVTTDAT